MWIFSNTVLTKLIAIIWENDGCDRPKDRSNHKIIPVHTLCCYFRVSGVKYCIVRGPWSPLPSLSFLTYSATLSRLWGICRGSCWPYFPGIWLSTGAPHTPASAKEFKAGHHTGRATLWICSVSQDLSTVVSPILSCVLVIRKHKGPQRHTK